jgi:hypothetical protein
MWLVVKHAVAGDLEGRHRATFPLLTKSWRGEGISCADEEERKRDPFVLRIEIRN